MENAAAFLVLPNLRLPSPILGLNDSAQFCLRESSLQASPSALTLSNAASANASSPQSYPSADSGSDSIGSRPESLSSQLSISGDTLADEAEPHTGLGSAVLLRDSTTLSWRVVEIYRHVALIRYIRALLLFSRSIPVHGVPVHRWPEAAEGILPYLDLTDDRVQTALPYFRSEGYSHMHMMASVLNEDLNNGLITSQSLTDGSTQQYFTSHPGSNSNNNISPSSSSVMAPIPRRQWQEMVRFSDVHGRISGCRHALMARNSRSIGVGVLHARESSRMLGHEAETSNEAVLQWPTETLRKGHVASTENFKSHMGLYPASIVSRKAFERPPTLPALRVTAFRRPSDFGKWNSHPPRGRCCPPTGSLAPIMTRPNMLSLKNCTTSLLNTGPCGAQNAETTGQMEYWYESHLTAPHRLRECGARVRHGTRQFGIPGGTRRRGPLHESHH